MSEQKPQQGDLSVTALYTSYTWVWGGLPCARLFETKEARAVFRVTNFALLVARLFLRGLRSLRHSLLHRHAMIDALVQKSGAAQILELAAGLSRRGATVSADPAIQYVEVDLPPVVERKRALLERTDEGKAIAARPNLRFVPADVAEADLPALVDPTRPVCVIAEGLLMYLKPDQQRALWRRVAALIERAGGLFVFDLVPTCEQPRPGLVGRSLEWLMKRFTGGRAFERDPRTRLDVARELREAGFASVELLEPENVAELWGLPHPRKKTQQLLFVCRPRGANLLTP